MEAGCQLLKSHYNLDSKNYKYVALYLSGERRLQPEIDLGGRIKFTEGEWVKLLKCRDQITYFIDVGQSYNEESASEDVSGDRTARVYEELCLEWGRGVSLYSHTHQTYTILNRSDWWALRKVFECIEVHFQQLRRMRVTLLDRINTFRNKLRQYYPLNIQHAAVIIHQNYNRDCIIDCELYFLGLNYLFETYVLDQYE